MQSARVPGCHQGLDTLGGQREVYVPGKDLSGRIWVVYRKIRIADGIAIDTNPVINTSFLEEEIAILGFRQGR